MKNQKLYRGALIVLPVLAMMVAGSANSVMVYSAAVETTAYCSYLTLIEDITTGICLPMAALCCGVGITLGVVYCVGKKEKWLKMIFGVSFAAALLAVLPILMEKDVKILPNVMVPIAMSANCLIAYVLDHKPKTVEKKKDRGPRLSAR